jgi:pimeloyl-ACP methyl ester carboxylesterase
VAAGKATIADYDWIGFDPRGVGSSMPAISCQPNYSAGPRKSYNPTTREILSYWLSRTKHYDQACRTHSAAQEALLHNMTTKDSARDMNSIRAALGRSQITYYGFSYGTYLGQVYASMFPTRVRRLIMDSNVDPRNIWYKANLNQDIAFNRNENIWFAWPAPASKPEHINGSKIHSALLIDETLDAATPFEGSVEVRRLFPHSVLLAEPGGTTHADSLFGDLCVDNTIAKYLANGTLPKRSHNPKARWDTTCKPLPVPVPTTASASASANKHPSVLNRLPGILP